MTKTPAEFLEELVKYLELKLEYSRKNSFYASALEIDEILEKVKQFQSQQGSNDENK